jgi:hypothetical protein
MSVADFRDKHPKLFKQALLRGIQAEKARAEQPDRPRKYGKFKHTHLINVEKPLLASTV